MKMKRLRFEECDSTEEICGNFNRIIENLNLTEAKVEQIEQSLGSPSKKKKPNTKAKKGSVSMKTMIVVGLVTLLTCVCFATVTVTDISMDTVQPEEALIDTLRSKFAQVNTDVTAVSGFSNLGTGKVFYVDSAVGNDSYVGTKPEWATATLDAAVGLCTANRGDVIFVMQGHAETMGTASVNVDIAGITIVGLGNGDIRPTFTFDTATDTFDVAATGDNVIIANLRFVSSVTVVAVGVDVIGGAVGVSVIGCDFVVDTAGTDEFEDCISIGAAADRALVANCLFDVGAVTNADSDSGVHFLDSDSIVIKNNTFYGDYSVACIENITTASNFITVQKNLIFNGIIGGNAGLNAQPGIELVATTTGIIADNYIACNLSTKAASVVAADCYLFENYYNEDESGAATGGIIGAASADD